MAEAQQIQKIEFSPSAGSGYLGECYFFFLNQPIRNKIPIRNAGPSITRDIARAIYQGSRVSLIIEDVRCAIPARIKAIPPTISYFQEIDRTITKINTGILCINNPINMSPKLDADSKTSKENRAKNSINKILNILGIQYTNLLIFFTMFEFKAHFNISFLMVTCFVLPSSDSMNFLMSLSNASGGIMPLVFILSTAIANIFAESAVG